MKLLKKLVINILLAVILVFSLAVSFGFIGVTKNRILTILIIGLLVIYNIKPTVKFTQKIKTTILIILLVGCFGYILIPKKNTVCQAPVGGIGCASNFCVGIPIADFVPRCLGKAFGAANAWHPDVDSSSKLF
jgi:hypothetical protein